MNKLFLIPILLLSLISFSSLGADFQKGVDAHGSGDYATALREFTSLAEQGNSSAQFKSCNRHTSVGTFVGIIEI